MNEQNNYYLKPGYIYADTQGSLISTVLGSCVSVCFFDTKNKFGGINHFIYPKSIKNEASAKYGSIAIPHLLNIMLKLGADKNNLIAHIVGGAGNENLSSGIGIENVEIAKKLVSSYNIPIQILDIGGTMGRKVVFNSLNGELVVYKCTKLRENDWYE